MLNTRSTEIFRNASDAIAAGVAARADGLVPSIAVVDGIYGRTYHVSVR